MGSKKIIILGGNSETGAIVEVANAIGLYSIVIDPYSDSPSKKKAAKAYEIDVRDLDAIDRVIKDENVDGVLVGVADPLVFSYQKICARNNFYCYANENSISAFTSKLNFAQKCTEFKISVTPNYYIDYHSESDIEKLEYPVVIKPVDAGAGVGISVCRNLEEFRKGVNKALIVSIRKEIIVEKFMECDDMFVYYTFVDGIPYISAITDRYKTDKQGDLSSVCIAAEYPSQHTNRFINEVHPKLLQMFHDLEIQNAVLCIQFFVDKENFYAYDPGFRLQGEAPHLYLKHFNNFDHREMLLNYALSGKMYDTEFQQVNDYTFNNKFATTVWVLLKSGKINYISGFEAMSSQVNIIKIMQRLEIGDTITNEMLGTESQVFARIYTVSESTKKSAELIKYINYNIKVLDEFGNNMILDWYEKS